MESTQTSKIKCPDCGHKFLLNDVLSKQMEEHIRHKLQSEFTQKHTELSKQVALVKDLEKKALLKQQNLEQELQNRLNIEKKQLTQLAQKKAEEQAGQKLKFLEEELKLRTNKQRELEKKEIDFLRKMRQMEDQQKSIELEYEKKFITKTQELELAAQKKAEEQADLKVKERDTQIEQMRKTIEDLKRKSEQGSMQVQGDALENNLKDLLSTTFPVDSIEDVPTGIRGADLVQTVRNELGQVSGTLLWELKNTKTWSDGWIRKLKNDQAEAKADIAILATRTLPQSVETVGNIDGVWVVDHKLALVIAGVLRKNLINLEKLKQSYKGTDEKMNVLHQYLTGSQFKTRIENIVLSFSSMKTDLESEKRAFQRIWNKRDKEIDNILNNTTGLYGDLQGIMGNSLQSVPALELEASPEDLLIPPSL